MTTLVSLVEKLEPGDNLAWVGEKSIDDVERVYPKTITEIRERKNMTKIKAEGIHGGEYFFTVSNSGDNEAFFVNPNKDEPISQGEVVFAQLTTEEGPVPVKKGFWDDRHSN